MVQAVVFDLDGVIVDSEKHWGPVETEFFQSFLPNVMQKESDKFVGMNIDNFYDILVKEYGFPMTKELFMKKYDLMAEKVYKQRSSLLPGLMILLTYLKSKGIPVGIASSSPRRWVIMALERFMLMDMFSVVVSAEDLGNKGKPSPAVYLHACALLEVNPSQTVAVEDSQNGVVAAKNADMICIGLRNGFNDAQDLSNADIIAENHLQIKKLFQTLW